MFRKTDGIKDAEIGQSPHFCADICGNQILSFFDFWYYVVVQRCGDVVLNSYEIIKIGSKNKRRNHGNHEKECCRYCGCERIGSLSTEQ